MTTDSDLMALAKRMRAMERDPVEPLTDGELQWVRGMRKICEAAGMFGRVLRWLFVGAMAIAGGIVAVSNLLDKFGGGKGL